MTMTLAAFVEPHVQQLEDNAALALEAIRDADAEEAKSAEIFSKAEQILTTNRAVARLRRIEAGRALLLVRAAYPKKGPKSKAWGEFLERIHVDQVTAWRYMELAGATPEESFTEGDVNDSRPQGYADIGLDNRPRKSDESSANRPDYGGKDTRDATANLVPLELDDPEPKAPDRNTWCTPKKWADAIGPVDLDPCSNERSHIHAKATFVLERGENGLMLAAEVPDDQLAFINCPYGRGLVIQWVRAYGNKRFVFLLKFDPSTKWFAELIAKTAVVMFPKDERMEFEPPPGVEASSVQFPHAFFYAREEDITNEMRALCLPPWRIRS